MNYNSPGVYVLEKDISDYVASVNSSVVGIVGFASKGPTNKATLITSPQNLVRTFGPVGGSLPGQGLEGAVEILEATNSVYYVRVASDTAAAASGLVQLGACPSVVVSSNGYGVTQNLYLTVDVTDNNGVSKFPVSKQFDIPSGTVATNQSQALIKVIGGGVDQSHVGAAYDSATTASGYLFGSYAGSAATLTVRAYSDSARTTGTSALRVLGVNGVETGAAASSVTASGVSFLTSSLAYYVESLYPGTGYNTSTNSAGQEIGNNIEVTPLGNSNFNVEVNEDGGVIEQFKVSFLSGTAWIEDAINTGSTDTTSEVIKAYLTSGGTDFAATELTSFTNNVNSLGLVSVNGVHGSNAISAANPKFVKLVAGTYTLANGTNGVSSDNDTNGLALIGDPTTNPKKGIYALDDDSLNISIACAPGFHQQALDNAGLALAEASQNFIWLVAPPYGTIDSAQEAIDWHNGQSETRTAAINNSYGAVYFPWLQVFSVADGVFKWMDPTIFAARQMVFTDSVSEPWFAPAGYSRGRLTKPVAVEVKLNEGDRSALYSGGNVINPIVNFDQDGIMIFGQRTAQRTSTALDRINVRRLMIALRKMLLRANRQFTFEPNDVTTWEQIRVLTEATLEDIRRRRGITDYKVVCDETTNTPARIDRNELWCKVILVPTKAAEAIVFELNITSNSAKLGN
jgi:phage tail sheath protein FI